MWPVLKLRRSVFFSARRGKDALSRVGALIALACFAVTAFAEPVVLTAADGVSVYGMVWRAPKPHSPFIIAFHQAGSNHACALLTPARGPRERGVGVGRGAVLGPRRRAASWGTLSP